MRHAKQLLLISSVLLCSALNTAAQDFSYVYIQGDKKTPLYIKAEGEMLPRYGKNYALLSRLAPGPLNIDILFQQNEYPALHFTVLVPEHGKRAFLVNKKGDNFTLYDLEQHFDLKPNNDISDDHLPAVIDNSNLAAQAPSQPEVVTPAATDSAEEPGRIKVWEDPAETGATAKADTPVPPAQPANTDPKFIDNITFDNSRNPGTATGDIKTNTGTSEPAITNSDCKSTIGSGAYQRLYNNVSGKSTEEERLGLFLESLKQNCFSCEMTAKIVGLLNTDAARFSALKNAYPRITDQARFAELGALLTEAEWKEYFTDMVGK